jgi:hypothetical protein
MMRLMQLNAKKKKEKEKEKKYLEQRLITTEC